MNRDDGRAVLQVTAPDTITSWVASAFAMSSEVGLGVAPDTTRVSSHFLTYFFDWITIYVT